ncbi:MAG: EboA domain-containing protein [Planctomycetota bacterium]
MPPTSPSSSTASRPVLAELLSGRLQPAAHEWLRKAEDEVSAGAESARFAALLSLASRYAKRDALAPTVAGRERAATALPGWNPERWTVQEAARVALVLARPDLAEESGAAAVEEAFRYADEGELCALYRSLPHLPAPERFLWRAAEGCRTNMVSVFEADVLDTPYPARFFDDVAWNQAVIKTVFLDAPLWRLFGLDGRLSDELARMALDLVDERRSAHRDVQHELWLALGAGGVSHAGERGRAALEREIDASNPNALGRRAAAYALARCGETATLSSYLDAEQDALVATAMRDALDGNLSQEAFRALDPR